MGIVHKLPQHVANCIAAGEMVENPASVVKELCENAIDAGAAEIGVTIREGGLSEIVVTDDGCGMSPEDAETAFQRHATSKLSTEQDLFNISTLGFRGEALAAISAVSTVILETRTADTETGTRLVLEYGKIVERGEVVSMPGTTFTIKNLFRNTPARMKFLRTNVSEGSAVSSVVSKLALSHPEIRFTMQRDERVVFTTSGSGDLFQTITDVCGREFASSLVQLDAGSADISTPHIWGYVTQPTSARSSRVMQYAFLNGRAIQSKTVTAALEEAYHGFQTTGKFPGCVLHIALDPALADINVHPTKLTVKFAREGVIFDAVYHAVRGALEQLTNRPSFSLNSTAARTTPAPSLPKFTPSPLTASSAPIQTRIPLKINPDAIVSDRPVSAPSVSSDFKIYIPPKPLSENVEPISTPVPEASGCEAAPSEPLTAAASEPLTAAAPETPSEPEKPETSAPIPEISENAAVPAEENAVPEFRIAGVLFSTYIIVEAENEVLFIDFHATHERIRFDKLMDEYHRGGVAPQLLLSSLILSLSPDEYTAVMEHMDMLINCGVEAEPFGEHDIAIRALPPGINTASIPALISEICRDLRRPGTATSLEESLLHRIACHSAVRGGDTLSEAECRALAERVLTDPTLRCCPHGRPVALIMTKRDFIRNFER